MSNRATVRVGQTDTKTTPCVKAPRVEPCVLVIFGITGDLSRRKLIPALYELAKAGALPERFAVVGVSRSAKDAGALRTRLRDALAKKRELDEAVWADLAGRIEVAPGSAGDPETFTRLKTTLAELDERHGIGGNRLYYLAVAPKIFGTILQGLRGAGLIREPDQPPWSRVIVEKPIGRDLASARELNQLVGEVLHENQTYRIDHYLGKETVQNLIVLRFANSIFEPLWNRKHIDHVQVTAAESILVSGRGGFYDQNGVVRDIVQNHLLQILALVAMEPPVSLSADDVRDQKVQAIRSLRPIDPERDVVFGQYRGYQDVEGVAAGSRTPTYVALRAWFDNWRWHGVPFYLRAGKGLPAKDTEVSISFLPIPGVLFGRDNLQPNRLVIQIQPNEGVALKFSSKVPGEDVTIGRVTMDMTYAEAFERRPGDAYERLLLDGMRGDATLFARRDEVEQAWRWVDPFLGGWEQGSTPIPTYEPGSEGPTEADGLPAEDGREWRPIGFRGKQA